MHVRDEEIIRVDHVTKTYPLYANKTDRVLEAFDPLRRKRHTSFSALKDISFVLKSGESLGIMGVNGSGKSTLLKILTGILTPTRGAIRTQGKIAALLELGAGFHPERTGLDNIYFQGTLQGLSKAEIEEQVPDIIAFADIGDFINQPVKLYSSGMFVRLAFATAVQGNPDIFIVDEALAVGDIRFQRKCFQRIEQLKEAGATFIFVSHESNQIVTHCSRAILLSNGELIMDDNPRDVANKYMDMLFGAGAKNNQEKQPLIANPGTALAGNTELYDAVENPELRHFLKDESTEDRFAQNRWYNQYEYRWGDQRATIFDVYIASSGDPKHVLPGDYIDLYIKILFHQDIQRPIFGLAVKTPDGVTVYGTNTIPGECGQPSKPVAAGTVLTVQYHLQCNLPRGRYFLDCGVAAMVDGTDEGLDRRYDSLLLTVEGPGGFWGLSDLKASISRL